MARTVLEVFLSSTAKDLAPYRDAVYERLRKTGLFHCIRQEDFGSQDAGAVDFCREGVAKAEMFVGLVGLRRGWEPDGDNAKRSITEMEHDWAREFGRRRFIWVAPDDFAVPGNLRESDAENERQQAFRKRVMAGGERIVTQSGFTSPEVLAADISNRLMTEIITGELITVLRSDLSKASGHAPSAEQQAPVIAAAIERLADDKDIDLLKLARNPAGIDVADLEAKLKARADSHEAAGRPKVAEGEQQLKQSAEYWRHIGALAFLHDTHKSLAAYVKATELDPSSLDAWRFVGELHYRLGDLAAAEAAFERLLKLSLSQGDQRGEALARTRLGWIALARGKIESALEFQSTAVRIAERANWPEGMARAYANLGIIHQKRGKTEESEAMLRKALALHEELGSKDGMARAYGNLGIIHLKRGNLDESEAMILKALKLFKKLGSNEGLAANYGNLGIIHQKRGDLDKAENMHRRALAFSEELGSRDGMARAYGNLGNIHAKNGDMVRACTHWRTARDIYRAMDLSKQADEWDSWMRRHNCKDA